MTSSNVPAPPEHRNRLGLATPEPLPSFTRMRLRTLALLVPAVAAAACSGGTEAPAVDVPTHAPERSEILFQAVDAGTGGALADTMMTVRHLVRYPITLDSVGVDQVSSTEPYHIAHQVGQDSLVVEVRVDASSYHRLDTALVVARGASVGPLTLRMARRLERTARRPTTPSPAAPSTSSPSRPAVPPPASADPDAGADRRALQAGNRAFQAGDWLAAADAYGRMPKPSSKTSAYAGEYTGGLVRLGVSHLNRGELAAALEALQQAVTYPDPGYAAYLHLGQAQCTAGRLDEGRRTLGRVERASSARERPTAAAMAQYQLAMCSYWEFKQAKTTMERVGTGSKAVKAFEAFIQTGQAMNPAPAPVTAAISDAQAKVTEIRNQLRRGGDAE